MSTLEDRIRNIIATQLNVELSRVTPEKTIMGDLWADSLAAVELSSAVEEAFHIEIPERDLRRLRTVGDIITYVDQHVGRTDSAN
ncbi:MAG: acyl carrier protein [Myxococcota bacterium]